MLRRAALGRFSRLLRSFLNVQTHYSLRRRQFNQADEIVGDDVECEILADALEAAMLGLAHRAVLFAPAEDAFDRLAARLG